MVHQLTLNIRTLFSAFLPIKKKIIYVELSYHSSIRSIISKAVKAYHLLGTKSYDLKLKINKLRPSCQDADSLPVLHVTYV